jgi:putative transposase
MSVRTMCRMFGVSPSGFYAWRTRPESTRVQEDRRLKVLVHASFTAGRGYYGSPRIYDDFVEWQEPVSRKRIIRLMQEDGLKARVRKRYKGTR